MTTKIRKIPQLTMLGPKVGEETILPATFGCPITIIIQGWTDGSIHVYQKFDDKYTPDKKWEYLDEESDRLTLIRNNLQDKSWNNFISVAR